MAEKAIITVEIAVDDTIEMLKERISMVEGIPVKQQRIVFAGRVVEDVACTMRECGIKEGDTVHVVLALRGLQK